MEKRTTKLNKLDFSPGIRASEINENFELLKRWIDEERLRVSGWGLVEGFNLAKDLDNFTITVGSGVIIDKKGAQIDISGKIFDGYDLNFEYGLRPEPKNIDETVTADENGVLHLQYPIYSEDNTRPDFFYKIVYYESGRLPNDLTIIDEATMNPLTRNDVDTVKADEIKLMPGFEGKRIIVRYKYANDRIDGIFLNKKSLEDGSIPVFRYEIGQETDTPLCHEDEYIIGYAYWHVDKAIDVEFITQDRSYRQVYVDEKGDLYLMGEKYNGYKFIFFGSKEEVTSRPLVNDLWYDTEENILKIWRADIYTKEFAWFPVNDLARFNREIKIYEPSDNPEDLQTFIFEDSADKNLVFVPKRNQLTIIIDQIVLMQDQFEELYDENAGTFEASGYGFRLIEPLDEPRVVEVRVEHSANTQSYTQDLFSKVAAFVSDGQLQIQSLNSKYHYLPEQYETGKCELELWLNGKRLLCGEDFFEARLNADGTKELVAQGDISSLSSLVYIDIPLSADDVICFKITRFMSTYSNFNASLEPIKSRITEVDDYSKGHIGKLEEDFSRHEAYSSNAFSTVDREIEDIKNKYREKTATIKQYELDSELESKIKHPVRRFVRKAYNPDPFSAKSSDYISVIWADGPDRVPLITNLDYRLIEEDGEIALELASQWESQTAKLYIEVISLYEE